MKWRKGPRPWGVHIFAIFLLANGFWTLWTALPDFDLWEGSENEVVGAFTIFTIVLIPVIAIWGFGSRLARALAAIFVAPSLIIASLEIWAALSPDSFNPARLAISVASLVAIALLFHPSAREWFGNKNQKKELPDPKLDF